MGLLSGVSIVGFVEDYGLSAKIKIFVVHLNNNLWEGTRLHLPKMHGWLFSNDVHCILGLLSSLIMGTPFLEKFKKHISL